MHLETVGVVWGFSSYVRPELIRAIVDCGFEHPSEASSEFKSHDWGLLELKGMDSCFLLRESV